MVYNREGRYGTLAPIRDVAAVAIAEGEEAAAERFQIPFSRARRARKQVAQKPLRRLRSKHLSSLGALSALTAHGMSCHQIAAYLGISFSSAHSLLAWAGYEYRWIPLYGTEALRDIGDPQLQEMRELADAGASAAKIASLTGLSYRQVLRRLRRMGYAPRWIYVADPSSARPNESNAATDAAESRVPETNGSASEPANRS